MSLQFSAHKAGPLTPPAVAAVIAGITFTVPVGGHGVWNFAFTGTITPTAALADITFTVRKNGVVQTTYTINSFSNPVVIPVAITFTDELSDADVIALFWVSSAAGQRLDNHDFVAKWIARD